MYIIATHKSDLQLWNIKSKRFSVMSFVIICSQLISSCFQLSESVYVDRLVYNLDPPHIQLKL